MNDHDPQTLHDIDHLLDEGHPAPNTFLNELASTQPVALSKIKARIEERLMLELAERKREKVNANGHFELDFAKSVEETVVEIPRRRMRTRLSLTMAATLLLVLFGGLLLVVMLNTEEQKRGGSQSQSELLTQSPTVIPYFECQRVTVYEGDTCESIAQQYNVSVEDLILANDLAPQCIIRFGQILVIPQDNCLPPNPAGGFPTPTATRTITPRTPAPGYPPPQTPILIPYEVQEGDTCQSIALEMRVTLADLITTNNLDAACSDLTVGQRLMIPFQYYTPTPYQTQNPTFSTDNLIPVVVAREELLLGESITLDKIGIAFYPPDLFPLGAVTDPNAAVGHVALTTIPMFGPIYNNQTLREQDAQFPFNIDPDHDTQISVPMPSAFAKSLSMYNRISIVITFRYQDICDDQDGLFTNGDLSYVCYFIDQNESLSAQTHFQYVLDDAAIVLADASSAGDTVFVRVATTHHAAHWIDVISLDYQQGMLRFTRTAMNGQIDSTNLPPTTTLRFQRDDYALLGTVEAGNSVQIMTMFRYETLCGGNLETALATFCQELDILGLDEGIDPIAYPISVGIIESVSSESGSRVADIALPEDEASAIQRAQQFNLPLIFTTYTDIPLPPEVASSNEATSTPVSVPPTPTQCTIYTDAGILTDGQLAINFSLNNALPATVEVIPISHAIAQSGDCPILQTPYDIVYQITVPTIHSMTNEVILDSIIYAFPTSYMPHAGDTQPRITSIRVVLGDGSIWDIDLLTLQAIRERNLHGAELMAELENLSVAVVTPPSGIPTATIAPPIAPTPTDCPDRSALSIHLQNGQSAVAFAFLDVLPDTLEIRVHGSNLGQPGSCHDVAGPFEINYRLTVPSIDGMTNEDIVEIVIYGFPESVLPTNNPLFEGGDLTITIDGGRAAPRWRISLIDLYDVRQQDLHGPELMAELDDLSVDISTQPPRRPTIDPTVINMVTIGTMPPNITPSAGAFATPTDCPNAVLGVAVISEARAAIESGLNDALPVTVGVVATTYDIQRLGDCPIIEEISDIEFRITVPPSNLSDEAVLETIVYNFPASYLSNEGQTPVTSITVVIGVGNAARTWTINIADLNSVRQLDLHGQDLMDALGLDVLAQTSPAQQMTSTPAAIPTTQVSNPLDTALTYVPPEILSEGNYAVGDTVTLRFAISHDDLCNPSDLKPDHIQSICADLDYVDPSRRIEIRTDALIYWVRPYDSENTLITFETDLEFLDSLRWLFDNDVAFRIAGHTTVEGNAPTSWEIAACFTDEDLQNVYGASLDRIRQNLDDAFDVLVDIRVTTDVDCFTSDQTVVSYEITLPTIHIMSDTAIIETIVYAFPIVLLPNEPLAGQSATLTIISGSEEPMVWTIDLYSMFNAIRQGLHGQLLIDALGIIGVVDNRQSVLIPVDEDILDSVYNGDAVTFEVTFSVQQACFGHANLPQSVANICNEYRQATENSVGTYITPLLVISRTAQVNGNTNIVVRTNPDIATTILWLVEHNAVISVQIRDSEASSASIPLNYAPNTRQNNANTAK